MLFVQFFRYISLNYDIKEFIFSSLKQDNHLEDP
jgi:hypothetical protein